MNIECDGETLGELEHAFKFSDAVLRHLIVKMTRAGDDALADDEGREVEVGPASGKQQGKRKAGGSAGLTQGAGRIWIGAAG